MKYVKLCLIEPEYTSEYLISWLADEIKNIRHRFGSDQEALKYWPDYYYERLEAYWSDPNNRERLPIEVFCGPIYKINDGWHRFAMSHKLGLKTVPVWWET